MKPAGLIKADLHMCKSDARAFHVSGPLCNMLCVEDIVRVLLTVSLNVVWYRVTCVCVSFDSENSLFKLHDTWIWVAVVLRRSTDVCANYRR